jgi:tetratricopeptide (TPR) repeat protein
MKVIASYAHIQNQGMIVRSSLFLCFLLLGSWVVVFAQNNTSGSKTYRDAHAHLWTLNLQAIPQTGIPAVEQAHLKMMAIFLEVFVRDNESVYNEKLSEFNDALSQVKKSKGYIADYAAAEGYLLRAMLKAKFNQNIRAGMDLYSGYRKAKSNYATYPSAPPVIGMWGVMECGIGSLPDQIQTYLGLVGFSGDLELGMELVEKAYRMSKTRGWKHSENILALALVSVKVQLQNDERADLQDFGIDARKSPVMAAIEAKILFDRNESAQAFKLLSETKTEGIPFPYLSYLQGRIGVTLELKEGAEALHTYLITNEGTSYIKSTHRYLWWHYFLKGDVAKAKKHREYIVSKGASVTAPDQLALHEAQDELNVHLLRARLLFDRGKISECLNHLTSKKAAEVCQNDQEMGSYYYRMGRCLQQLNRNEAAINRYKQAVKHFGNTESFERANSLLQMGIILEEINQCPQAKNAYQEVLKFKNYPFNEGQHQKAKAGIKRCK